jgi:acetyltransferase EpsM
MVQDLVFIGGSSAYWEINEIINDINAVFPKFNVIGIYDDNESLWGQECNNIIIQGPIKNVIHLPSHIKFIFAIGSFKTRIIRAQILENLGLSEERYVTLIHPTVKVFSTARVSPFGCIIHYGTVIYNHTIVDSFSIIAANCVIAVGNYIGRGSLMGSNITTTTGVKIGSYSFIGSSTSIGEYIEIEPGAYIGMGSLVLKNISAGLFVLGQPLKVLDKIDVPEDIINEWVNIKNNKLI